MDMKDETKKLQKIYKAYLLLAVKLYNAEQHNKQYYISVSQMVDALRNMAGRG